MSGYKISSKYIENEHGKFLDVADNVVSGITRFKYEYIEENLLKQMPSDVLFDLKFKIENEIRNRYEIETKVKG